MKTLLTKSIIALFAIIISTPSFSQSYCDSTPVNIHGDLSVIGNKIVDQNNSPVSFAGNSMFWSNTTWGAEKFYNADVVSWLKEDWGATIVRAAMGVEDFGGYISDPAANMERITTVVDAAIAEGIYVIIDWHSHNAENYQQQSIDFFKEMATRYGDTPNVIYEVYNEPISTSWAAVKSYSEAVISEIRAIDPDNLIIVGSPTWSQDVDIASTNPITSSINIAYTLHFYAGTHGASLRAKAQTALNNGIALMATEWGTVSASGDGNVDNNSTDEWMNFLLENDISHLNWSVHDKSEGASIVNPGASSNGNWSNSDLTASGLKVKSIIESWAQYCDGEPIVVNPPVITYTDIPAQIEAEDYTSQSGTQLEDTEDNGGGKNVGYIDTNDSLTYNINVPTSGEYTIDFRVASSENGANFDIYSGSSIIGNISSNATGDWQNWETVSETVTLSQGEQTIRLAATGSGWNINWLEFSEADNNNTDSLTTSSLSQFSANGASQTITVNANIDWTVSENTSWISVDKTNGSNNDSVTVTTSENTSTNDRTANITISGSGITRTVSVSQAGTDNTTTPSYTAIPAVIEAEEYVSQSGTQTENSEDNNGGENVGYIDTGDFLTYNINVPNTADYTIEFRVASSANGANFDIYSGNSVIGNISSDATGGWQIWETVSETVSLNQGDQTIRLVATGSGWNINWLEFSEGDDTEDPDPIDPVDPIDPAPDTNCSNITEWSASAIYSQAGTQVVYENNIYENKWYTKNQNPVSFSVNSWDLWTLIGPCSSSKASDKNDFEDDSLISVFQNSSTKSLNIYVNDLNDYSNIIIFDIQGRKVLSQKLNQNSSEISLEGYKDGIYVARFLGKKTQSKTFLNK